MTDFEQVDAAEWIAFVCGSNPEDINILISTGWQPCENHFHAGVRLQASHKVAGWQKVHNSLNAIEFPTSDEAFDFADKWADGFLALLAAAGIVNTVVEISQN